MAAPFGNQNNLKYTPEKVKKLFIEAIHATKQNKGIFNYPSLHNAIGLPTLRSLPYLAEKYQYNDDLMKLWNTLRTEIDKNLQIHIEKFEQERQSRTQNYTIEIVCRN